MLPVALAGIAVSAYATTAMIGAKGELRPMPPYVGIVNLLLLWPGLAGTVKRLHDRGRSGWWVLVYWLLCVLPWMGVAIFMVGVSLHGSQPGTGIGFGILAFGLVILFFLISLWFLIELGFLRGTLGWNRFGPDPLGPPVPQGYGPPPAYGAPPQGYYGQYGQVPPGGGYQPPPQPPPPGGWGQQQPGPWNQPPR